MLLAFRFIKSWGSDVSCSPRNFSACRYKESNEK
jgi:hypothetical protein